MGCFATVSVQTTTNIAIRVVKPLSRTAKGTSIPIQKKRLRKASRSAHSHYLRRHLECLWVWPALVTLTMSLNNTIPGTQTTDCSLYPHKGNVDTILRTKWFAVWFFVRRSNSNLNILIKYLSLSCCHFSFFFFYVKEEINWQKQIHGHVIQECEHVIQEGYQTVSC